MISSRGMKSIWMSEPFLPAGAHHIDSCVAFKVNGDGVMWRDMLSGGKSGLLQACHITCHVKCSDLANLI